MTVGSDFNFSTEARGVDRVFTMRPNERFFLHPSVVMNTDKK